MKKFSNIEQKETIIKQQKTKYDKVVEKLVSEKLQPVYNGNLEEILNKNITVEGVDIFIEGLVKIIEEQKDELKNKLFHNLKYKYGQYLDQKSLNEEIKITLKNLHDGIIVEPSDVFCNEDYNIVGEKLILNSMSNIPVDFMDYVTETQINKYFTNGNSIIISNSGNWNIIFENSNNYGTIVNDNRDKYKLFISENKEFIADFLNGVSNLIGNKNILLEKRFVGLF